MHVGGVPEPERFGLPFVGNIEFRRFVREHREIG